MQLQITIDFDCDKIIKPYRPANLTQEEYDRKVKLIYDQIKESKLMDKQFPEIIVTCPCGRKNKIQLMFKCFYCKVYYCEKCARDHFKIEAE